LVKKDFTVISLGGSLLFSEDGDLDAEYVKSAAALIRKMHLDGCKVAVSVGGGKFSGQYQDVARKNGMQVMADKIGQMINHVNATLLISLLGEDVAYPKSITDLSEVQLAAKLNLIPVGAGFVEGATSDHAAVIIAERLRARRIINLSKVDGVYDSDPSKNPKAKLIRKLSYGQLIELATRLDTREPKAPFVFDVIACKLAARSGIEIVFANGRKLDGLRKLVKGRGECGTVVG
jgi:uridylate kinase